MKNIKEKANTPPQTIKDPKIIHGKRWSCKDAGVYGEGDLIDIRIAVGKLIEPYDYELSMRLQEDPRPGPLLTKSGFDRVEDENDGLAILNANTEDDAEWKYTSDTSRKYSHTWPIHPRCSKRFTRQDKH